MKKIRVWDLPVRLFHWALVLLIVTAIVTQKVGGNAMEWHFLSGYAVLTLIFFRILWGLIGTRYARFTDFIRSPASVIAYMKPGKGDVQRKYPGHNPVGSLSVLALLGVVLLQALSGLFANDDIASEGPLVKFISKTLSDQITWFHKEVTGLLIYILIGLHIVAIAYYYFRKKENLVTPMITGDKEINFEAAPADDSWKMRSVAAVVLALCAAAVYYLVHLKL